MPQFTDPEEEMRRRSRVFDPDDFSYEDPIENPPDLDRFYGPLRNYIKMVTTGHSNLLMLDAKGGLGKTHNVREVLSEWDDEGSDWTHLKGFTTPVELFTTLWKSRDHDHVLFLDDMSGITNNVKALDMMKAATETQGAENWVQYRSSQGIDHPYREGEELPQTFNFGGRIIMSFNETPDNNDFNALKDRGTFYQFNLDYHERLALIREIAKLYNFSPLSLKEQQETAEWVASVTDPSIEVSIRTFENVCNMRHYGQQEGEDWEKMALEVFNLDYQRYLIVRLRESDLSVENQIEFWREETGTSQRKYYDLLSEIKTDRMDAK